VFCCQKLKNYGKRRTNGTEEGLDFGVKMGVDWVCESLFPDKSRWKESGSGWFVMGGDFGYPYFWAKIKGGVEKKDDFLKKNSKIVQKESII